MRLEEIERSDPRFLQKLLKWSGLDCGAVDGIVGVKTKAKLDEFQDMSERICFINGEFDTRSELNIQTLILKAQEACREWMRKCKDAGLEIKVICGSRTDREQNALYAQGRTTKGKIVTNAKAGQSSHNKGIAWDFGVFRGKEYFGEHEDYKIAGKIAKEMGLVWGGDWKSFKDLPHVEIKL